MTVFRRISVGLRNISNVVEKTETHILRSVTFPPKNRADCEMIWKLCRAEEATDASIGLNTANALCMLDAGCRH